ncbi:MAG: DUF4199 domain-containing protein [Mediterranea massiliensis]|nr:DUF4199 domain-containing protein [Mediterranea massiliensis]
MTEDRRLMQRYAMLLGTYMGVFWILKFIFFPLGMSVPFFSLVFMVLTLCVPFMGYYYARMYRNTACGGFIGFGHAWWFTTMMYMFAAVLTAVAHYIYFRYIDQGFMINTCEEQINLIASSNLPGMEEYANTLREALEGLKQLTPIDITMQMISQNVFIGAIMAVPTAMFVARKPQSNPNI